MAKLDLTDEEVRDLRERRAVANQRGARSPAKGLFGRALGGLAKRALRPVIQGAAGQIANFADEQGLAKPLLRAGTGALIKGTAERFANPPATPTVQGAPFGSEAALGAFQGALGALGGRTPDERRLLQAGASELGPGQFEAALPEGGTISNLPPTQDDVQRQARGQILGSSFSPFTVAGAGTTDLDRAETQFKLARARLGAGGGNDRSQQDRLNLAASERFRQRELAGEPTAASIAQERQVEQIEATAGAERALKQQGDADDLAVFEERENIRVAGRDDFNRAKKTSRFRALPPPEQAELEQANEEMLEIFPDIQDISKTEDITEMQAIDRLQGFTPVGKQAIKDQLKKLRSFNLFQ